MKLKTAGEVTLLVRITHKTLSQKNRVKTLQSDGKALKIDVGVDPKKSTGVDLGTSSRVESSRLPLAQSTRRRMSNCKVTSPQVDPKYIFFRTF